MPNGRQRAKKVGTGVAKEVSVLAWIQDAYGNVLLVRQTAGRQLWSLPGGKVRAREGLKAAIRREIKEEIGLSVVSAKVIDLFDRPPKAGLAILFQTLLRKGRLKIGEGEIRDAAFVSKLPTQATPSVRHFWRRHFSSPPSRRSVLEL